MKMERATNVERILGQQLTENHVKLMTVKIYKSCFKMELVNTVHYLKEHNKMARNVRLILALPFKSFKQMVLVTLVKFSLFHLKIKKYAYKRFAKKEKK